MTKEKFERTVTAVTVACTTLFVFLLAVLVYQWVTIAVQNKRIDYLESQIETLSEQKLNKESQKEFYESLDGLEHLAWRYGRIAEGDNP